MTVVVAVCVCVCDRAGGSDGGGGAMDNHTGVKYNIYTHVNNKTKYKEVKSEMIHAPRTGAV